MKNILPVIPWIIMGITYIGAAVALVGIAIDQQKQIRKMKSRT